MRILSGSLLGLAALVVLGPHQLGCSSPPPAGEATIRQAQPIQGGIVDKTDSNVVAILIGQGGQLASLCSGALIGPNLVLTAHHCVANPPSNLACGGTFTGQSSASSFVVTTSYDAAYAIWTSSNPKMPTADDVTWWAVSTVTVPGANNICAGDQAMLTLSANISGVCPLIPAVDVEPTDGETYTAVGFGITSPNGQNAGERYEVTGMAVQCVGSSDCQDNTIAATGEWQGGSSANKGTCEGDSGGPALDASKRILGTVSRGPSNACNQTVYEGVYDHGGNTNGAWIKQTALAAATAGGYTAAGWVTGGATSDPANGYCGASTGDAGAGATDAGSEGGAGEAGTGSVDSGAGSADASEDASTTDAGTSTGDAGTVSTDSGSVVEKDASASDSGTAQSVDSGAGSMPGADASLADDSGGSGADASGADGASATSGDAGSGASGNGGGCGCTTVGTTGAAPSWLAWMAALGVATVVGGSRRRRSSLRA